MMDEQELLGWFAGRIPDDWFTEGPRVTSDRDEVLITGVLSPPKLDDDASGEARAAALRSRVEGWREETRAARIKIARAAEHRFGRKVSWGAGIGDDTYLFTTAGVPVMTRLRMTERKVLDTLIDSGVARSRSDALAWCVRLVGSKQSEWLDELRDALVAVEKVRSEGPDPA
ncbi:MAG: hypothetical protein ACR2H7_10475 [Actinomycetota bacterium]